MQNLNKTSTQEALSGATAADAGHAASALRGRAEGIAHRKFPLSPLSLEALSPAVMRQTLHELQVHQIELEMQNEELQRAQVQLDRSRARYFDLYDLAPVGYCTISEQGMITQVNLATATMLRLSRGHLVHQRFSNFIARTHQDGFYIYRQQVFSTGEPKVCELEMVQGDGCKVWVHLTTTTAVEDNGAWVLRVVLVDVSERKRVEDKKREDEARFRDLINALPVAVYTTDAQGIITHFNHAGVTLFGRMPQIGVDRCGTSWKLFQPDGRPLPDDDYPMAMALKGQTPKPLPEVMAERADGTYVWVVFHPTALFDARGTLLGGIDMVFDLTERKAIDRVLQDKNSALELATLNADRANRAKSDFLSSMSHELRTPLNAILGFAQLIDTGIPPPTASQKRSVDQILQAGWYLLDLINEILDLALVESGKLTVQLQAVGLAEVLQACHAMIEPQADKRSISVCFAACAKPYFIKADSTRIKQVLINLLSNAIKYNRPGGAVVVTCAETAPGRLRISIEDTGEGLPPEKMAQLFQPFNRLGQEARTEQGTGVGLVVTQRLVELMGGTMGVESVVGTGSIFWIDMELTTGPAPLNAPALRPAAVRLESSQQTYTVLYVEDNAANLLLVESLMALRPDIRLLSASNGFEGIELARSALPDVILMDIHLAGMSGTDVLKIMRADPATAHILVVALSAHAVPADIEKGLATGFYRYLTKPIQLNELMAVLDEALMRTTKRSGAVPIDPHVA